MAVNKWRLLLALFVCLLATGCWNRVEINEIAIVSATGVDWKDGNWVLSYQVVNPLAISGMSGAGGGSAAAVNVFSTKAESFRAAVSKASQETSRRLYFSHNQIVIVGQAAARKGMGPLLDTYLRNHDSRETVSVFLSKGSARHMLEQLIPLEKIPGAALQRMISNEEINSSTYRQMTIHQVLLDLMSSTKATGIPGLVLSGSSEKMDRADKLNQTNSTSKVRLFELGLISEDKLVGWISGEESQGVMWLKNHVKRSTVAFACSEEAEAQKSSAVRIIRAETKLRPVPSGGKWIMHIDVEAVGTLMEYNCGGDLSQPAQVATAEKYIEAEITSIIQKSWKAVRKHRADVLGFGDAIHKKYPKQWAEAKDSWNELFPNTKVEISVKVKVNSAGMSGSGFKKEQEKRRS
jgi:spore germination protein KC